jgi:hypothetical protein
LAGAVPRGAVPAGAVPVPVKETPGTSPPALELLELEPPEGSTGETSVVVVGSSTGGVEEGTAGGVLAESAVVLAGAV